MRSLSFLYDYGYRFNPHFFLGIGTGVVWGYHSDDNDISFPIYSKLRVDFSKTRNTFFVESMLGTYLVHSYTDGLPFFGCSVGYSLGNLDIAIRYLIQGEHPFKGEYYKYEIDNYETSLNSIGLSIGYRF